MFKNYLLGIYAVLLLSQTVGLQAQSSVEHHKVYYEEGRFAGWPANHGIWNYGNEIVVGFVASDHKAQKGHTYDRLIPRDKYGRSLDGGLTWTIEDAYHRGQTGWRYNNRLADDVKVEPTTLTEKIDFSHPDLALTFLRQTNSTGPSHFYYSYNRGKQWNGPYMLPNFGTKGVATRTDYIVDGPDQLTAFLTVAKSNEREGRVLCVRTEDGGLTWNKLGFLGPEPEKFEIMPSSVRVGEKGFLTLVRARTVDSKSSIASYVSKDDGRSWKKIDPAVEDTGKGGSPPALVRMQNNDLALGYIVRQPTGSRVCVKFSSDDGQTWGPEIILRQDGATTDAGYPKMIQRPDGKLVIVYYWNHAILRPESPYRYIAATVFDPVEVQR